MAKKTIENKSIPGKYGPDNGGFIWEDIVKQDRFWWNANGRRFLIKDMDESYRKAVLDFLMDKSKAIYLKEIAALEKKKSQDEVNKIKREYPLEWLMAQPLLIALESSLKSN